MNKKSITLPCGETLAYLDEGRGDPVVFLHGNMSSSLHFSPILGPLSIRHRCIVPDLRGFGDSSYLRRFDSLGELAEDVREFCEALGVGRAHFVGWSTGGGILLELAARYPGLVRSGFCIEGAGHMGYPIPKKDERGGVLPGAFYRTKEEMAADPVQVGPMLAVFASGNAALMGMIWDQTIYTVKKPTPEQSALWLSETMKQRCLVDLDWALACFNMGRGFNGYREGDGSISEIAAPMAFTSGDRDVVVPPAMVLQNYEALEENAELIRYRSCGHSPLVDIPEQLVSDIERFFYVVANNEAAQEKRARIAGRRGAHGAD